MSVKVAVRVRPFNSRELELNSELCLDMHQNTTTIKDITSGNTRDFTFDYSFWSHDCFETSPEGLYVATSDKYADQNFVFQKVGIEILDNAWQGYHCCLFAYGQTGAGKSYSMVGYGPNKGIVPISCEEIFTRIEKNNNPNKEFQIQFSMLEIYNEKIQDLLIPINQRPHGGLKVREHKTLGVYVEDLTKHPVDSYISIEAKMEEGNRNRTIGSTLMNASSSRAHTIITIEFKQIDTVDGRKSEKLSVINLVDLAGSEKLSKTGATGDRMKEGCAINKSLTILGIVISSLAEKSSGKKNIIIPYRDSALTRILQNALGGNSKTLMICALSPATNNYDETLSTLRYADQAKKIKLHAVVNESEQDKLIRELREENEKLRDLLKSFTQTNNPQAILSDPSAMEKIKDMEEQLKCNSMLMQEYEKSFDQRLKEAKEKEEIDEYQIDYTKPFLMNLNEDPLLNGKINYSLTEEITHIGRKNGNPPPKILLGGIGIKQNHANITNSGGKVMIQPADKECGDYLYVNGTKVFSSLELNHNDRLIFGTNNVFLVKIPGKEEPEHDLPAELDWDFVQKELMSKLEKNKKLEFEEYEKAKSQEVQTKIKVVEEQLKKEKEDTEVQMKIQKEEYEKKLKELEEKIKTGGGNLEQEKDQAEKEMMENVAKMKADYTLKEKESEKKKQEIKFKDKHYLERKLSKYLPKILEINLIAKELKKNVSLNAKLSYTFKEGIDFAKGETNLEDERSKFKIIIQVMNREYGYVYYWEVSKFSNRYYLIKDILENYFETNELPILTKEQDPFWDPPEPHLIGQSFLKLMSLAYILDYSCELAIVGEKGSCGSLNVKVVPTDEKGEKNLSSEMEENGEYIDDPNELLGKRFDFKVIIENAVLPENICTDVFAEYTLNFGNGKKGIFQTNILKGRNPKPDFGYCFHHCYDKIEKEILDYLLNQTLCIQVYGIEEIQINTFPQIQNPPLEKIEAVKEKNKPGSEIKEKEIKKSETGPLRRSSLKLDEQSLNENEIKNKPAGKKEKKPGCVIM